jgi:peptide/nickel transport system substrate-binding protein
MNPKSSLFLSIFAICMLFISACGGAPTPEAEEGQQPDVETSVPSQTPSMDEGGEVEEEEAGEEPVVLRVGWLDPIDCWNPFGCTSFWFTADLYGDPYFGKGDRCKAIPTRLLDSWELSEDGLTWTATLDDGITFSNGEVLDAEVAAGFLEWWASIPSISFIYTSTQKLESVEVVDELTFKLHTVSPVPFFADVDALTIYPLPPSVTENLTEENVYEFENFPPQGAGPYVVSEWEPGSYVIFDARPEYHRGKPPIDRIVLQIYANTDAMVGAYLGGELDMTTALSAEFIEILEQEPNTTIYELPAGYKYEIEFNVSAEGNKHPAIDDPAVREAIDYAIDREQVVNVALLGYGELCPTNFACPSALPEQLNPNLGVTPHNPARAAEILAGAGYVDSDGDAVLETPDGLPLKFRLAYELEDTIELTIADLVAGYLREVGIAADIEALEAGVVTDMLSTRDFDMFIYHMYTDVFAPIQFNWTSSCESVEWGPSGLNFPGYCNPEFDALISDAYDAFEPGEYEEAIFEAQSLIYNERPFIVLAASTEVQAVRNDRFEFPELTCHLAEGRMVFTNVLMNATVK